VCFVAFASLAPQARGLFGVDGIEPAGKTLTRFADFEGGPPDPWTAARTLPSLVWWAPQAGLPFETAMEVALLAGAVISAAGLAFGASTLVFASLYALYLTAYGSGGTTMSFQWDLLLLEVCVAAALHAPPLPWWTGSVLGRCVCVRPGSGSCSRRREGHSHAGRWLLRFILFKLMLMAGVVKVFADCPAWKGMSALAVHFQGQCLPHALSWWAAQAPPLLLKAGVAATLLIEGPLVPLLLVPFRPVRAVAAWFQILLQLTILLSGSYNFFNLATILLACVAAMEDRATTDDDARPRASRGCCSRAEDFWAAVSSSRPAWALGVAVNVAVAVVSAPVMFRLDDVSGGDETMAWWRRWDLAMRDDLPATTRAFVSLLLPRAFLTVAALIATSALWQVASELQPLFCSPGADEEAEAGPQEATVTPPGPASFAGAEPPSTPDRATPAKRGPSSPAEMTPSGGQDESPGQEVRRRRNRRGGRKRTAAKPAASASGTSGPQAGAAARPSPTSSGESVGVAQRIAFSVWTLAAAAACLALCAVSAHMMAVTLVRGGAGARGAVPFVSHQAEAATRAAHNWKLASTYGLFRQMTGMGRSVKDPVTGVLYQLGARPEVIVEGTRDAGKTWAHLPFAYKPGIVELAPALALPHQPRLDWQMWFAALGTYNQSPWVITLVDKLMEGSPDVVGLLDTSAWPFLPEPGICEAGADADCVAATGGRFVLRPDAVRARLVHLDFTRLDSPWARLMEPGLAPGAILHDTPAVSWSGLASVWHRNGSSAPWWTGALPASKAAEPPTETAPAGTVSGGSEFLPALVKGQEGVASALEQIGTPRISTEERASTLRQRAECRFENQPRGWSVAGPIARAACLAVERMHEWGAWRPDLVLLVIVGAAAVDRSLRLSADDVRAEA